METIVENGVKLELVPIEPLTQEACRLSVCEWFDRFWKEPINGIASEIEGLSSEHRAEIQQYAVIRIAEQFRQNFKTIDIELICKGAVMDYLGIDDVRFA